MGSRGLEGDAGSGGPRKASADGFVARRNQWLFVVVAVALIAAPAVPDTRTATAAVDPPAADPNIVFIMVDDLRFDGMEFGFGRSLDGWTSARDPIGRSGNHARDFFATTPLCCPSRASFLTGQYAHDHRVFGNDWAGTGGFTSFFEDGRDDASLGLWMDQAGARWRCRVHVERPGIRRGTRDLLAGVSHPDFEHDPTADCGLCLGHLAGRCAARRYDAHRR